MFFLGWIFFSIVAGMFAQIRRNRNGAGWFFVAIFFSPLVAFVLLAILQPGSPLLDLEVAEQQRRFNYGARVSIAIVILVMVVATAWTIMTVNAKAADMPLPSIRGMYCNSPCTGTSAPDRHMGELAALVIFRKQCAQSEGAPIGLDDLLAWRFHHAWSEWNAAPEEIKRIALRHEFAALDARRQKYSQGQAWFCKIIGEHIDKGDYQDIEKNQNPPLIKVEQPKPQCLKVDGTPEPCGDRR
jgi:hypothetical protein